MNKTFCLLGICLLIFCCKKEVIPEKSNNVKDATPFVQYTIPKGGKYCNQNTYKPVEYAELNFVVKFDSTAIYSTVQPANQGDINKLYGFSDNNSDHQQFSARFGWRWSDDSLQLFGYTYNNGIRESKKIGSVNIGDEIACSIKVTVNDYIFSLNNIRVSMQRRSKTPYAIGYKLYPYFGGDEMAPHNINIWIKELP